VELEELFEGLALVVKVVEGLEGQLKGLALVVEVVKVVEGLEGQLKGLALVVEVVKVVEGLVKAQE
jgi:hypothetical protein